MVATVLHRTVAHLRKQVESPADDELLRRFSCHGDATAFAELVGRHGAMVMGVARRALDDHHAAEDVLQATFILLARKAKHVRWHGTIGPWLYAAAVRFARKAVERRNRYPETLGNAPLDSTPSKSLPVDQLLLWQEVRTVLDEELARLPESLRAPLVLCYLQGLTRDEAAPQLGWTVATLKRRLEKGRERLRVRLSRRGLGLTAALGAILIGESALSAATVCKVVETARAGTCSTPVAALLGSGIGRWQKALAILVLATFGMGGVMFATLKPASGEQPAQPPAAPIKPAVVERMDALGDPLPDGAMARLGTVRLNTGNMVQALAFSPDGTRLAIWASGWGGTGSAQLTISDVATGRELRFVLLPPSQLVGLRWLADGRGLAVAKISAREYYIWEFTDENAPFPQIEKPDVFTSFGKDIISTAISPDGRWLATGRECRDGQPRAIELWEVTPNSQLSKLKSRELGQQSGSGQFVLFSDDGQRVFALSRKLDRPPVRVGKIPAARSAERDQMVVYETATGKRLSEFDVAAPLQYFAGRMATPQRLALSPDGKSLFVGDELGTIHTYDWATGKESTSFVAHADSDAKRNNHPGVAALAFSVDGQTLYSAGNHSEFTLWDTQAWKPRLKLAEALSHVGRIAVSPTGTKIAVADPSSFAFVYILDAKSGKDPLSFPGRSKIVPTLALTPDGMAVTADYDQVLHRWDTATGRERSRQRIDSLSPTQPQMFTADGLGIFGSENNQIVHIDLASGKKTQVTTDLNESTAGFFAVSGSSVFVTSQGGVRQWDSKVGRWIQTYKSPKPDEKNRGAIGRPTLSPDGRRIVFIGEDWKTSGQFGYFMAAKISLYDTNTSQLRRKWRTAEMFKHAVFSPDGKFLLVGGNSGGGSSDVPIEDPLPISAQSGLLVLDAESGEPIRSFEQGWKRPGNGQSVAALAFSTDSTLFAAAQPDASICIYELATGNLVRTYHGHRNQITQMAFTADGRRLLSISQDMTGLVWDTSYSSLAKPSIAVRENLWADLAKPEWEIAGSAMAALAIQPDDLLTCVRDHLKSATGPDFDPAALTKLVAQLGDPIFAVRDRASAELSRLGREFLPQLRDGLAQATGEKRRRLQSVVDQIARSPVPSGRLREVRILALLEQQKSDAARTELERLATGHSDAALTRDAKAALAR